MEKQREGSALAKAITPSIATLTAFIMLSMAGLAPIAPASAHYLDPAQDQFYVHLWDVPAEGLYITMQLTPYAGQYDQWTAVTLEGWMWRSTGSWGNPPTYVHEDLATAHDLAGMAIWNRSTYMSDLIDMIYDVDATTYWHHADPNTNNFYVYPERVYMVHWNVQNWLWYDFTHPPQNPPDPPPWSSWLLELYFGSGFWTFVQPTDWAEMNPEGYGYTHVGLYGYTLQNNKPVYASDLIDHMYYHNSSGYAGQWEVAFWAGWGWQVYNPCHPEWDFALTDHMGYRFWTNQHAHLCFSVNTSGLDEWEGDFNP